MTEKTKYSVWMDHVPELGIRSITKMLFLYEDPQSIYELDENEFEYLIENAVISRRQVKNFLTFREKVTPKDLIERIEGKGVTCVSKYDDEYPQMLHKIQIPPVNLYVMGSLPCEFKPSVGIVGARLCSDYGRLVARRYGEHMALEGIQVISGLAMGVDGIAQKATIEAGGTSYGILGCGVDYCYPPENQKLYEMIIENGGIISEYPPGVPPRSGLFPLRNRIISGLSDALLVVEAREKSGTLITVDRALEQGKEVFAIPGKVIDRLSSGCNRLISQGATIALSPNEVTEKIWELYRVRELASGGDIKNRANTKEVGSVEVGNVEVGSVEVGSVEAGNVEVGNVECDVEHKARTIDSTLEEKNITMLHNASPLENAIYGVLDINPKTPEEIKQTLEAGGNDIEITLLYQMLMKLKLKGVVTAVGVRYARKF
ncbi:MAG: DNA-processing protein DprA [Lachnospiraceae bacterium]|nr:DNA-processing protein DprA [Candidatus Merdinaster equi]